MNHREVVHRALSDRLKQYEGCSESTRAKEREKFLQETTDMVIIMILRGTPDDFRPDVLRFSSSGEFPRSAA